MSNGFFRTAFLRCFLALTLLAGSALTPVAAGAASSAPGLVLRNPVFPTPSQDPWVVTEDGRFYEVHTDGLRVFLRSSDTLGNLMEKAALPVWAPAPGLKPGLQHVWAPEMHRLHGKWWLFFAADYGNNEEHRIFALESQTDEPLDGFVLRGEWKTGGWAIDPTVLTGADGALYALWSGWPGESDGQQNLYISRMKDPATLAGPRVALTTPTEAWERVALPVCEGPEVLRRGGETFVVYSASGSWTPDYCLGLLVNRDGDYMNPASWKKEAKPVLARTDEVWGVGHCCFLSSPQTGDLIFYHAKTRRDNGWGDRNVRVQPFTWRKDGLPEFGKPVRPGLPIAIIAPGAGAL